MVFSLARHHFWILSFGSLCHSLLIVVELVPTDQRCGGVARRRSRPRSGGLRLSAAVEAVAFSRLERRSDVDAHELRRSGQQ